MKFYLSLSVKILAKYKTLTYFYHMENGITLVVANEHTLGYFFSEKPNEIYPLASSVIKGATNAQVLFADSCKLRLAKFEDFEEFRVSADHYFNGDYNTFPTRNKIVSADNAEELVNYFFGYDILIDDVIVDDVRANGLAWQYKQGELWQLLNGTPTNKIQIYLRQ